jgi:hypothetical protein
MNKKKRHPGSEEKGDTKDYRNFSTLEVLQAVVAANSGIMRRMKFAITNLADFFGGHSGRDGF